MMSDRTTVGTTTSVQGATNDVQRMVVEAIQKLVAESGLNSLRDIDGTPIYDEPLVGFADGDDPLFTQYKTAVSVLHLTPREALAAELGIATSAEQHGFEHVGVVSWVLPIAKATRISNRKMTEGPSRRWNHTRFQGEDFCDSVRRHLVAMLRESGYAAVAPLIAPFFNTHMLPNGMSSNWSERHAAYAAGLGTFSLSDGLITAKGIAHRCGSVIANVRFEATPRGYTHHLQNCPYPTDGTCGACIERCPVGAIGPNGHDKHKCREYMFVTKADWSKKPGYMGNYPGCGLCQTKVPCESRIPARRVRQRG